MQSIKLKRQVAVKAIVTETFKTQATSELQQALQQIDLNLQQLDFQGKRAIAEFEKKNAQAEIENVKAQLENEKNRIMAAKNELLQRLNVINQLEMGSEFLQGSIENFVEIKVGDSLYEKLSNTEVIVKDGVVAEIRGKD